VLAPDFANRGKFAVIPEADHEPLRQRMVLMKNATPAAIAFYEYVRSEKARTIFKKYGYGTQ
jgi:molybdate transport system substrate-binding protein